MNLFYKTTVFVNRQSLFTEYYVTHLQIMFTSDVLATTYILEHIIYVEALLKFTYFNIPIISK